MQQTNFLFVYFFLQYSANFSYKLINYCWGFVLKKGILLVLVTVCVSAVVPRSPFIVSVYAQEAEEENQKEEKKTAAEEENKTTDSTTEEGLYTYDQPVVEEISYTWIIVKTLVVLALLVLGFFLFFRYINGKAGGVFVGRDILKVRAALPIGQNKMVQIVEVGSRLLVLGITDSNISLLHEITEKDEIDRIKLQSSAEDTAGTPDFQSFLKSSIGSFVSSLGKKSDDSSHNDPVKFHEFETHSSVNHQAEPQDKEGPVKRTYFEDDRLEYIRRQKSRLKRLGGFDNE